MFRHWPIELKAPPKWPDTVAITISMLAAAAFFWAVVSPNNHQHLNPAKLHTSQPADITSTMSVMAQSASVKSAAISLPPPPGTTISSKISSEHLAKPPKERSFKPLKATPTSAPTPMFTALRQPSTIADKSKASQPNMTFKKPLKALEPSRKEARAMQQRRPPAAPTTKLPDAAIVGRVLLRFQEHGKGPTIDIEWPTIAAERDQVYTRLRDCHSMVSMVMTEARSFFRAQDQSGTPWRFDQDQYSLFLRQPTGAIPVNEQRQIDQIRRHHKVFSGNLVRAFPRTIDAFLLGRLAQMIGPNFAQVRQIQGRYKQIGLTVFLDDIVVDGNSQNETIRLPIHGSQCGRL
ncbi:MAG: hypothetical protein VW124_09820 [Paracoccaceae bacterium]